MSVATRELCIRGDRRSQAVACACPPGRTVVGSKDLEAATLLRKRSGNPLRLLDELPASVISREDKRETIGLPRGYFSGVPEGCLWRCLRPNQPDPGGTMGRGSSSGRMVTTLSVA
jgi:hypothetical protein